MNVQSISETKNHAWQPPKTSEAETLLARAHAALKAARETYSGDSMAVIRRAREYVEECEATLAAAKARDVREAAAAESQRVAELRTKRTEVIERSQAHRSGVRATLEAYRAALSAVARAVEELNALDIAGGTINGQLAPLDAELGPSGATCATWSELQHSAGQIKREVFNGAQIPAHFFGLLPIP